MTMSPTHADVATLAGICDRHGIYTYERDVLSAGGIMTMAADKTTHDARMGRTPEAAVCALLKARYDIGTGTPCGVGAPKWLAAWWEKGKPSTVVSEVADTELAAVVALADRLAGVGR